jgi:hypothetical protein
LVRCVWYTSKTRLGRRCRPVPSSRNIRSTNISREEGGGGGDASGASGPSCLGGDSCRWGAGPGPTLESCRTEGGGGAPLPRLVAGVGETTRRRGKQGRVEVEATPPTVSSTSCSSSSTNTSKSRGRLATLPPMAVRCCVLLLLCVLFCFLLLVVAVVELVVVVITIIKVAISETR